MVTFNASHNQLDEIPRNFFVKMPNLVQLDLSYNNISSVNWCNCRDLLKLEHLNLSNNAIRGYGMCGEITNEKLKTLRLENIAQFFYLENIIPLINKGVLVYVSAEAFDTHAFRGTKNIRVIANSSKENENLLTSSDGTIELHCSKMSTKHATIRSDYINNPNELVRCLSLNVEQLSLLGTFTEGLDSSVLQTCHHLNSLLIENMQISDFDLMSLNERIHHIRIRDSNLKHISNVAVVETFKNLNGLELEGNQIDNIQELIHHLDGDNMHGIAIDHNSIGMLNSGTFEKLTALQSLKMKNTSLLLEDLKPFDSLHNLFDLDISYNNLENTNFTYSSPTFKHLNYLNVAHCKIENISEIMKQLDKYLTTLSISHNNFKTLNADTFAKLESLTELDISYNKLLHIDFNMFECLHNLYWLDLSSNSLSDINFTSVSRCMKIEYLYLQGNDLTELVDFTVARFPDLKWLDISQNQFSCDYLATFLRQIQSEFPDLKLVGDWRKQKHSVCHAIQGTFYIQSYPRIFNADIWRDDTSKCHQ